MATDKKRIQAYVNDSTYQLLKDYSDREGCSISEAASSLLQTHLTSGSDSSNALATGGQRHVTFNELIDFSNSLYAELGKLEGRYQAYAENLASHQTSLFESILIAAKNDKLLPEASDSKPPSKRLTSSKPPSAASKALPGAAALTEKKTRGRRPKASEQLDETDTSS